MKVSKVKSKKAVKKDVFYVRGVEVRLIKFFDKLAKEKGYTTRGQLMNHILDQLLDTEDE